MAIQEWNGKTEKYLAEMISAAIENNILIRALQYRTAIDYQLYEEDLDYRITLHEGVEESLKLIRSLCCNILWHALWMDNIFVLPIGNGDILRLNIDIDNFDERYEQLLLIVTRIRVSKIIIANSALEELHGDKQEYVKELLQILVNKGNTTIEFKSGYNLNFLESCNVSLE